MAESEVSEVALSYYEQLVAAIPVDEVLVKFIPKKIINFDDKQLIKAEKSDKKQAEFLLDNYIMKRIQGGDESVFYTLLEAMRDSRKCDNLVKKIYTSLGKPLPPQSPSGESLN